MKTILALLLTASMVLSSCVSAVSPDGTKITALGGKGALKSPKLTLVYNNEKSFRDGTLAVTSIAAAAYSAATQAAAETTAQVANTNAAKVAATQAKTTSATAINASNNATKVSLKALEVAPVAP